MSTSIQEIIENLDLNSNLASLQTIHVPAANDQKVVRYEEYEEHVQDTMGQIIADVRSRHHTQKKLRHMANLFQIEVPLESRPALFRQLNSLMSTLMTAYIEDKGVYESCFQAATAFKNQLDQQEQADDTFAEIEWEELQKSVYLLTDWEDHFRFQQNTDDARPELKLIR